MADFSTRELEHRALAGDVSALLLLRLAYLREGRREDVEPRFWILSVSPLSPESEPCGLFQNRGTLADPDRVWRTPVRTLEEIADLHRKLGEPVQPEEGEQHHNRTGFTVLDSFTGRLLNVAQGLGDSGDGYRTRPGLLTRRDFDGPHGVGRWSERVLDLQRQHQERLEEAKVRWSDDVPWTWFVKELCWHVSEGP